MEQHIDKNLIIVLGNNQDSCLLTGDNKDVTEFSPIQNNELNSFSLLSQEKFRIKTGMNICAAYLKSFSTTIFFWGKIGKNSTNFISLQISDNINKCAIGDSHIILLTNKGDIFVGGEGNHGQLGLAKQIIVEISIMNQLEFSTKIRKIYAGVRTSFFIDENKNLYCCGSNKHNELGLISSKNKSELNLLKDIESPVFHPYVTNIMSVQCGFKHTIFVLENKEIYGAGDNSKGVLGLDLGFSSKDYEELKLIKEIFIMMKLNHLWNFREEIKKIKCGWNNTLVLTTCGKLFSTGYGRLGQLGYLVENKTPCFSNKFQRVSFPYDTFIVDIVAGSDFFIGVDKNRNLYSWGWNEHYNLGLKHNKNVPEAQLVRSDLKEMKKDCELKIKAGGAFLILYNKNLVSDNLN